MNKVWLIASSVYMRRLRSKSFLFITFAFPVLIMAIGLISTIAFRQSDETRAIGFVDETGRLTVRTNVSPGETIKEIIPFTSLDDAQAAFDAGQINAFLIIPPGYFEGEQVQYYGASSPGAELQAELAQMMRQAIQPQASPALLDRITQGPAVTYTALDVDTQITSGLGLALYFFAPGIMAFIFAFIVLFTTGQMGSAIVREKEQRAMEMIITSLKPVELVAGKVLGLALLAITQLSIWIASAIMGAILFLNADFSGLVVPWPALLWSLLLIVPGYLLYSLLGAGAGMLTSNNQQAEGVSGFIGFLGFVPFWLMSYFVEQPDSPLSIALTIFPLTAPTVTLLRMTVSEVPLWQLVASISVLILTVLLVTWFIARIFRTMMLMYGQTARPRQIWRALRGV